jgi:hypothetical protein
LAVQPPGDKAATKYRACVLARQHPGDVGDAWLLVIKAQVPGDLSDRIAVQAPQRITWQLVRRQPLRQRRAL